MGANNADFNGVMFGHEDYQVSPNHRVETLVYAEHPEHGRIGRLVLGKLHPGYGRTIKNIETHPDFLRKGIATGMYRYAVSQGLEPRHSDTRTQEGDAWANSLGEKLPRNEGTD